MKASLKLQVEDAIFELSLHIKVSVTYLSKYQKIYYVSSHEIEPEITKIQEPPKISGGSQKET